MRICLLGEFRGDLDEGMRKTCSLYGEILEKNNALLRIDIRDVLKFQSIRRISRFNPQVIHFINGPSLKSLMLLRFLSYLCRDAKVVTSAMRPHFSHLAGKFIPLVRPDLVLVQSSRTEEFFLKQKCRTILLPSGVDPARFRPVSSREKSELRRKYGIEDGKFVILHIGSIKRGRNVMELTQLQSEDGHVLLIGSKSVGVDTELLQELIDSGMTVLMNHVERIEEIYAISDCYVFPTFNKYADDGSPIADSIEMPLSVLEAMATNLPVVSRRFGALPRMFSDRDGFHFIDDEKEMKTAIESIKNRETVRTIDQVSDLSWQNVTTRLNQIYKDLIQSAD